MAKNKYNWANRSSSYNKSSSIEGYSAPSTTSDDDTGIWAKSEPPPAIDTPSAKEDSSDYGFDQEPTRPSQKPPSETTASEVDSPAIEDAGSATKIAVQVADAALATTSDSSKASAVDASADPSEQTTTIGPTIVIRGKLTSNENLVIRGRIEAEINSSKDVKLESSGIINADMRVKSVTVSGIIVGDIHAEERVWFAPEARVVGDVYTPRLVVEDGASFRGRIEMDGLEHLEGVKPSTAAASESTNNSEAASNSGSNDVANVEVTVDVSPLHSSTLGDTDTY